MLIRNNIQPIYSSPNHPESNGGVERGNQTLKNLLTLYSGDKGDWVRRLPDVVRVYNGNMHATTKRAPVNFFLDRADSLKTDYDQKNNPAWREPSHRFVPFMVTQLVGRKVIHSGHQVSNKFAPRYEGPFRIAKVYDSERSYDICRVNNETDEILPDAPRFKVHHVHLKPWIPRPNYLGSFDLGGGNFPPGPVQNVQDKQQPGSIKQVAIPLIGGGFNISNNILKSPNTSFIGFSPPRGNLVQEVDPPSILLGGDEASSFVPINQVFTDLLTTDHSSFVPTTPLASEFRDLVTSTPVNEQILPLMPPLSEINVVPPSPNNPRFDSVVSDTNTSFLGFDEGEESETVESEVESDESNEWCSEAEELLSRVEALVDQTLVRPGLVLPPDELEVPETPPELARVTTPPASPVSRLRARPPKPPGFYRS
ncbi:unnamed protein product [Rotaria magnacalcarata]|uniref:Integrase catalytic domain-containing protein n=1 Tax=Rotaria magnacalcarata TaxID=392030 RepID=A0A816S2N9_9BILA|nr:unnamed protein product [Rotaria magnacalcarata]